MPQASRYATGNKAGLLLDAGAVNLLRDLADFDGRTLSATLRNVCECYVEHVLTEKDRQLLSALVAVRCRHKHVLQRVRHRRSATRQSHQTSPPRSR